MSASTPRIEAIKFMDLKVGDQIYLNSHCWVVNEIEPKYVKDGIWVSSVLIAFSDAKPIPVWMSAIDMVNKIFA